MSIFVVPAAVRRLRAVTVLFAALAMIVATVGAPPAVAASGQDVTAPGFATWEQGTLSTGSGAERNASTQDNTTRIRLADKVAVDPSWQSLTFTGDAADRIIVFAYTSSGGFISQSSTGWDDPSGAGYTFTLPTGTAYVDVVLRHTDSSVISVGDRTQWLSVHATTGGDTDAPDITDAAFYTYEQGTIASADGTEGGSSTRVRLASPAAVDPTWRTLEFASTEDVQVTVFAYAADGTYLAPSTGWKSLTGPYAYTVPAGTATIAYVLRRGDGTEAVTPSTFDPWVTIRVTSTGSPTTPVTPVPLDDPAWNRYEQGTIASADGTERDNASDVATRIRLVAPVAVDPSWQALKLDAGQHGSGLSVTIFAYDASGRFLSPSSGWKSLASPYVYLIPAGTVTLDWALTHDTASVQPISVGEQSPWLSLSTVVPDPRDNYIVDAHTITPQFAIPGIVASQGGNFVDGNLWEATASDDGEGAANGNVYVYSMDYAARTATQIHHFKHNFGHLNSFSYDPAGGNLIFGNGSSSYTQAPRFYVVKAANIDLDGTNTLAGVHATTFTVPADFGAKSNVIWTDRPNEAVMLTDDGITVRRIRLATGTEHLDLGDYSPAAAGEYNGTWTVLSTYRINSAYDVVQSASWVDGHLVIGLGHGPMSIAVIDFEDDGHMHYLVHRDAADAQFFESVFYDPAHHWFGGGNASTGTAYLWDDANFDFVPRPDYTISYDLAGGTGTVGPTTYAVDSRAITLGVPFRYGYTFTGWTGTGLDTPTRMVTVPTGSVGDRAYVATWSGPPAWSTTVAYAAGSRVSYGGKVFDALWYSKGETPGSSNTGAWEELAGDTAGNVLWTSSRVFQAGDVVLYDGVAYVAQWYSRGEVPGSSAYISWKPVVDNQHPAPWSANAVYYAGDRVTYAGHTYAANWYTAGQTPATSAAWSLIS